MQIPSRVMIRGLRNVSLFSPSTVVSVLSLGKSIHHFISPSPLRMINSVESSSIKSKALSPNRMEVSSGKSSNHSYYTSLTLKSDMVAIMKRKTTKEK